MSNIAEKFVFAFLNVLGGVPSFYRNIINGQKIVSREQIRVILLNDTEDQRPKFNDDLYAGEVTSFSYSSNENQYYVQKRLSLLIGEDDGAVITDQLIAVYAATFCKNPKTVFNLIHDYFYVNQNIYLGDLADVAVAHSSFFADAIYASNPRSFSGRSFYIPYGVEQRTSIPEKSNGVLNLVFLGRLVESKGVMRLIDIEKELQKKSIAVNWTIIGKGPSRTELLQQWAGNTNVRFEEPATSTEMYAVLKSQDIFVFPTTFEGTPVSILECLANAVVTIANDLPGGIRDIVKEGTGYTCKLNDINSFVKHIAYYHSNRTVLAMQQQNCFRLAAEQYDIEKNANNYFRLFIDFRLLKRTKKEKKISRSRLDSPLAPNKLVKILRTLRK